MWYDFERPGPTTIVPDDLTVAFAPDLRERIDALRGEELHETAEALTAALLAVHQATVEWVMDADLEEEATFADRAIAGEEVLRNPPEGLNPTEFGASLHVQILRGSERWMSDLYDCVSDYVIDLAWERSGRPTRRRRR